MQLALGLKVSQFVGLMGDAPPPPEQQMLLESQAREYISHLVRRLDGELLPDGGQGPAAGDKGRNAEDDA